MSTAYEQYRAECLADPGFKALYEQKRSEVDAIDAILSRKPIPDAVLDLLGHRRWATSKDDPLSFTSEAR